MVRRLALHLALHLVIDDLEERVGKLEAVAENHQYEQRKVSMQIEVSLG